MFSKTMEESPLIVAEGLRKVYSIYDKPHHRLLEALWPSKFARQFVALDGVSFSLERGRTLGIIGANGAGKSTLLQILAGTVRPSSGTLAVKGRVAALLELGAGFNPEFTGRENVVINAAILGLTEQEIEAKLETIIAFADIGAHIDQPVKTYSSGMYVRLAFAVAAHVAPDILIVDEALAVGDARFQAKCMRRIRSMLDEGATLLLTSHDVGAIKALCERCLWLEGGRLKKMGAAAEVTRAYDLDWVRAANEQGGVLSERHAGPAGLQSSEVDSGRIRLLACSFRSEAVSARDIQVSYGQPTSLGIRLEMMCPCRNLVISYHLKNRHGLPVIGGHTGAMSAVYDVDWQKGQFLDLTFEIPTLLQHGAYSLTLLAASIEDLAQYSDAVFHLWEEAAGLLQVRVRPLFPLSDWVELPPAIKLESTPRWLILDDFYPNLLTGFRVAEYNAYLKQFSRGRILSTLPEFPIHHAALAEACGTEIAEKVVMYEPGWLAGVGLIYLNFLNNADTFLPELEKRNIPFILTLYPGGGFCLEDPVSDSKLLRVLRSPLLKALIVTQPVTAAYVTATVARYQLPLPDMTLIPGVVVAPIYFPPLFSGHLDYYGGGKPTLDICFVAERYMPLAQDKGYPVFVAAMKMLLEVPELRVHVVGGGYDDEERALAAGLGDRIRFYGRLTTLELMQFYRGMDIIVAPNRPDTLFPGAFDGFPTGCCVEASLSGVLLIASDPLGQNPGYADGQDIRLLPTDQLDEQWAAEIAAMVMQYAESPSLLKETAEKGQQISRLLYAEDRQIQPRIDLWRRVAMQLELGEL